MRIQIHPFTVGSSYEIYTQNHARYCGIDLHARSLYVCILNQKGEIQVHKNIKTSPKALASVIKPSHSEIVIGVEFCSPGMGRRLM